MSEERAKRDVLLMGPPTENGEGVRVLRQRDDAVEVGELRRAKEGKPILGELVKLTQREEHERLYDVEVVVPRAEPQRARSGPAQVATDAYREHWDAIFARDRPN